MSFDERIARWVLAAIIAVGFLTTLAYMLWADKEGVELMVGSLVSNFGICIGYWFASSSSSERKTEALIARKEG